MTEASHPSTILLVDDDPRFRSSVVDAILAANPEYRVLEAGTGGDALQCYDREARIDAVVTDIRLPRMGGLDLMLALQDRRYTGIVIVVTAHGHAALERQLDRQGACRYFEKPVDLVELVAAIREAVETERSRVFGITLPGFAQLLEIERKTCLLQVRMERQSGDLLYREGRLVHARAGKLRGDEAALEIFGWEDTAELDLLVGFAAEEETVTGSLSHLLLEAMRLRDEEPELEGAVGDGPGGDLATAASKRWEDVANIEEYLRRAMEIEGAIGASLVDVESGVSLGDAGGGDGFDVVAATAGNAAVVRSKMAVIEALGLEDSIEDILITLDRQYHLIRPLAVSPNLLLFLALDRRRANLAMARHRLASVEREIGR